MIPKTMAFRRHGLLASLSLFILAISPPVLNPDCSVSINRSVQSPLLVMKMSRLFFILAFAILTCIPARAATYSYPSAADAWFTFELPDEWNPKITDETLEATAPHNLAYVAFWVLKDKSDFKNVDNDIEEILKDSVTELKMTKDSVSKEINGIHFLVYVGTGKDRKEKTPVTFEVWMFSPKPGKVGLLYFDRDSDATAEIKTSLKQMVDSIKLK